MEVYNFVFKYFCVGLFLGSLFIFPQCVEAKSSTTFSQSILPVKFVYVDDQNSVSRVWSNVKENDSLYVVKFFSKKDKNEIKINNGLIEEFGAKESAYTDYGKQSLRVDVLFGDGTLEEVRTFV